MILSERSVPSFAQWLDDTGGGERGVGFAAFEDITRRTLEAGASVDVSEDERSFLRMWTGMLVAVTELCNREMSEGRSLDQVVVTLPRVLGCAAIYAVATALKEDAPLRTVAKVLNEEFRWASKEAADHLGREGTVE